MSIQSPELYQLRMNFLYLTEFSHETYDFNALTESLKKADINHFYQELGGTILSYAVQKQKEKIVQFLIKNKADPNVKNDRGLNAFELAKNNEKIFSLLSNANNKPKTKENRRKSFFDVFVNKK